MTRATERPPPTGGEVEGDAPSYPKRQGKHQRLRGKPLHRRGAYLIGAQRIS
jgi:hypothetical protein